MKNLANLSKFDKAIFSRESKGLNTIVLVMGARGVGKSWFSLLMSERESRLLHERRFTAEDVVFTLKDVLSRLNYFEEQGSKWQWMVFDETGLEVGARDFMAYQNKVMSFVCESFRKTAVNLIVIVPTPSMLDINVRNLADFWVIMQGRGKARVYKVALRYFRVQTEPKTPIFCLINAGRPSKELCEEYEKKRDDYLKGKYLQWEKEIATIEEHGTNRLEKQQEFLREIKKQYLEGKIEKRELGYRIQEVLGISQGPAYRLRNQLLKEVETENP